MKSTPLFAFWHYSSFPYVLGATVLEMRDDGCVRTEGYGHMWFKPIKLMPVTPGKNLWKQIEKMRGEHREASNQFNNEWIRKINKLAPFLNESR